MKVCLSKAETACRYTVNQPLITASSSPYHFYSILQVIRMFSLESSFRSQHCAVESSDKNIQIVMPGTGNMSHIQMLNYRNVPELYFKFKLSDFVYF